MRICHGKSKIGSNKRNFDSKIRSYSSCNMPINQVFYWTDSVSVLKCINDESNRFHTFESNRLTVIHSGSSPSEWHYVNMDDNPAGKGPKGLKLDAILKNDRWLKGPKFLWEDGSQWCSGQILEVIILRAGMVWCISPKLRQVPLWQYMPGDSERENPSSPQALFSCIQ